MKRGVLIEISLEFLRNRVGISAHCLTMVGYFSGTFKL
jgi:hypothetical protein